MKGNMAPTNKHLVKIVENILKLIQEANPLRSMAKDVDCNQSAESNISYKNKWNGVIKKNNLLVDNEWKQSIMTENLNQYTLEIENEIKYPKKWIEKGINICDKTVRNRFNEMDLCREKLNENHHQMTKRRKWN